MEKLKRLVKEPQKLSLLKNRSKALVAKYDTQLQYNQYSDFVEQLVKN